MKGYAENAVCPWCKTYTQQRLIGRGMRECLNCDRQFRLADTERIQHGKLIKPKEPPK